MKIGKRIFTYLRKWSWWYVFIFGMAAFNISILTLPFWYLAIPLMIVVFISNEKAFNEGKEITDKNTTRTIEAMKELAKVPGVEFKHVPKKEYVPGSWREDA